MTIVDYVEKLHRLAIGDQQIVGEVLEDNDLLRANPVLDPKSVALVRLAALFSVGGAGPSYGVRSDAAVSAGATGAEMVDVLVAVAPVVGTARVIAAAGELATALGHDLEQEFEV
jgi:4-carboxymuconolactone decarboxylase